MTADRLTPSEKRLSIEAKRLDKSSNQPGKVLLEGEKLVSEALAACYTLLQIWFQEGFAAGHLDLMQRLRTAGFQMRQVSGRIMRYLSSMETPPGIIAVCPEPVYQWKGPGESFKLILVLTGGQDPGNIGGAARTLDFFGGDELWLDDTAVDPFNPKVVRGTMGAWLRRPMARWNSLFDRIRDFKSAGAEVWAAAAHIGEYSSILKADRPRILILGAESRGLSPEYLKLADKVVTLPGAGRTESLNLSVAAGILMYQILGETEALMSRPKSVR